MLGWFSEETIFDPFFLDKDELLPDGSVLQQQEIRDLKDNEEGFCTFFYYYDIWENYHFFGLPHDRGWNAEEKWLIHFLKAFQKTFQLFEGWQIKQGSN